MVNNANFYRYTIYNKTNHLVFVTSIIINTHVYLDLRGHTILINLGPFDSKVDMGCRYGSDFCVCVCVVFVYVWFLCMCGCKERNQTL